MSRRWLVILLILPSALFLYARESDVRESDSVKVYQGVALKLDIAMPIIEAARSAGKTYEEAVGARWKMKTPMPEKFKKMVVLDAAQIDEVGKLVSFVFCAVDMKKDEIKALEEAYAKHEIPVVSNNSAHR